MGMIILQLDCFPTKDIILEITLFSRTTLIPSWIDKINLLSDYSLMPVINASENSE